MYDLYDQAKLAVAKHKTLPAGAPLVAWSNQLAVTLSNGTSFPYSPQHAVPFTSPFKSPPRLHASQSAFLIAAARHLPRSIQ